MNDTEGVIATDRVTTRLWQIDLLLAGEVRRLAKRPPKRQRQHITRFEGCEGSVERFSIRQTIPYAGHETESPPSQAQYGAVCDFFIEGCETRFQATTLLDARSYAEIVADDFRYDEDRQRLIWISTCAFILSDKHIRSLVRSWYAVPGRRGTTGHSGSVTYRKMHGKIERFALRLIADMRAEGAEIFG